MVWETSISFLNLSETCLPKRMLPLRSNITIEDNKMDLSTTPCLYFGGLRFRSTPTSHGEYPSIEAPLNTLSNCLRVQS